MKANKRLFFIPLLFLPLLLQAQRDPVDRVFEKYSGKEGFSTVYITPKMFSLLSEDFKTDDPDFNNLVNNLKSIRILSTDDDSSVDASVNFYDEIMKDLPVNEYEELMVIQSQEQKLKFLVKEKDGKIVELLLVSGGGGSNTLIDIRGLIDLKQVSEISKMIGVEGIDDVNFYPNP